MPNSRPKPKFRPAVSSDIPFILDLVREFYARDGGIYGVEFDDASARKVIEAIISKGICIVGPTSVAGAIISPFPWNHCEKVAQVMVWYFRRPAEIVIFEELKRAVKVAGATHINASAVLPRHSIERFYAKNGLHPAEIRFFYL